MSKLLNRQSGGIPADMPTEFIVDLLGKAIKEWGNRDALAYITQQLTPLVTEHPVIAQPLRAMAEEVAGTALCTAWNAGFAAAKTLASNTEYYTAGALANPQKPLERAVAAFLQKHQPSA
ncbi:MAG: hypothetical protein P4M13_01135 [Alphaproteobacteria bacterium]|nr:hypothetical protein [Alphaproteobacteria bacterium]